VDRRASSSAARSTIRSGLIAAPNRRCSDGKLMSPARWTSPSSNPSSRSRSAQIRSTAWSTATGVGERNSTRRALPDASLDDPADHLRLARAGWTPDERDVAGQGSFDGVPLAVVEREVAVPVDEPLDVGPHGHARCTVAENEARGGEVHPTRATRGGDPFSELLRRDGSVLAQLRVS